MVLLSLFVLVVAAVVSAAAFVAVIDDAAGAFGFCCKQRHSATATSTKQALRQ